MRIFKDIISFSIHFHQSINMIMKFVILFIFHFDNNLQRKLQNMKKCRKVDDIYFYNFKIQCTWFCKLKSTSVPGVSNNCIVLINFNNLQSGQKLCNNTNIFFLFMLYCIESHKHDGILFCKIYLIQYNKLNFWFSNLIKFVTNNLFML